MQLSGIVHQSVVDGPGIRVVIFTQGCPHHCQGCHNPETWDYDGGEEYHLDRIMNEVLSIPYPISGVTISGGEPFAQPVQLKELCKRLYERNYEIAIYTGYTFEELYDSEYHKDIIRYVDILIDGKFDKNLADKRLKFKGSSNQRVIDVQRSLTEDRVVLSEDPRWI